MVDYDPDPDSGGAYYGWNPACNNSQNYISSTYCRDSGWHRYDTDYPVSGVTVDYKIVDNRCWGSGRSFTSRNAWRWRPPGGYEYRCSDGQMVVTDSSGTHTYNTVCRWKTANCAQRLHLKQQLSRRAGDVGPASVASSSVQHGPRHRRPVVRSRSQRGWGAGASPARRAPQMVPGCAVRRSPRVAINRTRRVQAAGESSSRPRDRVPHRADMVRPAVRHRVDNARKLNSFDGEK